jgi:hypothetical protein
MKRLDISAIYVMRINGHFFLTLQYLALVFSSNT